MVGNRSRVSKSDPGRHVVNSVAGELLKRIWNCIVSFGRFIELRKAGIADNSRLEMKMFSKNVTFPAFDYGRLVSHESRGY